MLKVIFRIFSETKNASETIHIEKERIPLHGCNEVDVQQHSNKVEKTSS